ncbi:hypothetical protein HMPREF9446_00769 [Bacteroides fluxus YIT 12057]|uniref:Uncharacterized protein n=1 Tax=Bacteroides fluxus YIT 12057 TaxID=763034 RepID=F3PPX7_9BACE|nr:hypothetical protein HMPREF9446_00769 [Bacteroides fluxus YIT 12057]
MTRGKRFPRHKVKLYFFSIAKIMQAVGRMTMNLFIFYAETRLIFVFRYKGAPILLRWNETSVTIQLQMKKSRICYLVFIE